MSIIRTKKKKHNFTIIDNTGLIDPDLTWKETGLLAFLMTKPDDWEVSIKSLTNNKQDKRDSVTSAISGLQQKGYVYRKDFRDKKGRFQVEYLVFETREDLKIWLSENPQNTDETGTEKPERKNRNGKTVTEKPERTNRNGRTVTEKPDQVIIDIDITDQVITELVITDNLPPYPHQNGEEKEDKSQPVDCEISQETGNRQQAIGNREQAQLPDQLKPEFLPHTDNPSLRQNSAAPLKNGFQQLSGINPKTGKEYFPWQGMENNRVGIDPKFLEFVAKILTSKYGFYKDLAINLLAGEVKKYVRRADHEDQRLAEIWDYWEEYLTPSQLPDVSVAEIKSISKKEQMIAELRARGYK